MSTPTEEIFLYGQTFSAEESSIMEYLDLTVGASIVFAGTLMLVIILLCWEGLASGIVAAVKLLVTVRSPRDLFILCYGGFKKALVNCLPVCLFSAVLSYYFPFNCQGTSLARVTMTLVVGSVTYNVILLPVAHYLVGLTGGLGYRGWEQWEYCFDAVRDAAPLEIIRCEGVGTGIDWRQLTESVLPPLYDEGGEVAGIYIFIFAAGLMSLAGAGAMLVKAIRRMTLFKWIEKLIENQTADRESQLRTAQEISTLSAKVETCVALLEQHGHLLSAKSEGVRTPEKPTARPMDVDEYFTQFQNEATMKRLRDDVTQAKWRFARAQKELKDAQTTATARERNFQTRIDRLQQQLSHARELAENNSVRDIQSLKAEIKRRTDQLASVENHLAAAEAREKHHRNQQTQVSSIVAQNKALVVQKEEQIAIHQKLAAQYEALLAQNEEHLANNEALAAKYQDVAAQNEKLVVEHTSLANHDEQFASHKQTRDHDKERLTVQNQDLLNRNEEHVAKIKKLTGRNKELAAQNEDYASNNIKLAVQYQALMQENQKISAQCEELSVQHQDSIAQNQELVAQNQALVAEGQVLAVQYQELVGVNQEPVVEHKNMCISYEIVNQMYAEAQGPAATMQQERDSALEQIISLQSQLATAETMVRDAQDSVARAQQSEEGLRQSMRDHKAACDSILAQERADAASTAESTADQISTLEGQIVLLTTRNRMAIKDLQRSSERLAAAEKAKTALEQLMNKKEVAQDKDKEPETPKARTSEFKPITSALEQSRVKISEQESEIKHLRNQLSQATQGIVGPSEQLLKEQAKDLRELLEKEKRQRTEDQINWDKLTRELEEKTRKLRISQSNDNPALVQRRRRPPVH